MASLNKVDLIGRVGKDPETRQFEGGNQICTFTLATSERYTDRQGQPQEQTEWHNIVLNGKLAALAQYIRKGSMLYIGGKIKTRSWTDQQGNKHYQTEIVGLTVQLLDARPQQEQQPVAPQPQYRQPAPAQPAYQQAPPAPRPQYPAPPQAAPAPQFAPAPAPQQPQYQQAAPQQYVPQDDVVDLPF